MRKKLKKLWFRLLNSSLIMLGGFLVLMATISPEICMFPFWHNEPDMPQSLRDKL